MTHCTASLSLSLSLSLIRSRINPEVCQIMLTPPQRMCLPVAVEAVEVLTDYLEGVRVWVHTLIT